MKRIRAEGPRQARGFTRWVYPIMRGYKMACCDCGLVHEMRFAVVKAEPSSASGTFGHGPPLRGYRVAFVARRAERYTAAERARMKRRR